MSQRRKLLSLDLVDVYPGMINNQEVDFVSKFKYLGVMFQTKGGNSEHLEMLKRKGLSACARKEIKCHSSQCRYCHWKYCSDQL